MRVFFVAALLLVPLSALADNVSRARLDSLREQIRTLEQRIHADLGERDANQLALRKIERDIGQLSREARTLAPEQQQAADRLRQLRDDHTRMARERLNQLDSL